MNTYKTSDIINEFAKTFGSDLSLNIKTLSNQSNMDVTQMDEGSMTLSIDADTNIQIYKAGQIAYIELSTTKFNNDTNIKTYLDLLNYFVDKNLMADIITRGVTGFTESDDYFFRQVVQDHDIANVYSNIMSSSPNDTFGTRYYHFNYECDLSRWWDGGQLWESIISKKR